MSSICRLLLLAIAYLCGMWGAQIICVFDNGTVIGVAIAALSFLVYRIEGKNLPLSVSVGVLTGVITEWAGLM